MKRLWLLMGLTLILSPVVQGTVIQHDAGHLILDHSPRRIAALNWTQAEMLLSLGVSPVGVTSIKGYRQWQSDYPPLPDQVVELGHRAEPSLEAIAHLQPDLILGYNWRHTRLLPVLEAIAPTALFRQYPSQKDPRDYLARMQTTFRTVGEIVGRQQQTETKLTELADALTDARARIQQAGRTGETVVVGKFVGMGLGLRVYGEASLAGSLLREIGLQSVPLTPLPGRDFTHLDLLKLSSLGDVSLILLGDIPKEARGMTHSPVWQQLPAVRDNRLYRAPKLWSFGGPDSAIRMLHAFTDQLAPEGT